MATLNEISFTVSAPGKIILLGEHSVVYGKTALAASLNIRTSLLFKEVCDGKNLIHLHLPGIDLIQQFKMVDVLEILKTCSLPLPTGTESFNLTCPQLIDCDKFISTLHLKVTELTHGLNLNHGQECAMVAFLFVLIGMFSSIKLDIVPFSMTVTSDLTVGAGTGSSASYGACLASAFYQFIRSLVANSGNAGTDISKNNYKSFKLDILDKSTLNEQDIDIILSWALLSDKIMHGNPSGIDATVITFGHIIEYRRGKPGELPFIKRLPNTTALRILLVNSGVSRNTKKMVQDVADKLEKYPKIINPILTAMDEVALTGKEIFEEMLEVQQLTGVLASTQLVDSNLGSTNMSTTPSSRPMDTKKIDALAERLGELMKMNQGLLNSLGVSHPTLDEICSIATNNGVSGKLTGAGGGGYAIILLPPKLDENHVKELQKTLAVRGYEATYALMGGAGVILDDHNKLNH